MPERGRPRTFDRTAALARAMEVFWVKGYEGSSMSDLTAAMGIASPSLYAAFGSKEELFRQALKHYSDTEGRHIWDGVEDAGTAYEAVESFLMRTARVFTRRAKCRGLEAAPAARRGRGRNLAKGQSRGDRPILCNRAAGHVDPGPRRGGAAAVGAHCARGACRMAAADRRLRRERGVGSRRRPYGS